MRPLRSFFLCGICIMALAVMPAWGAAAAPARVLLRAQAAPDGTVRVTATVMDARGVAVAEVPVVIKARTTFGWLTLLEAPTRKDGTVQATLAPGPAPAEIAVEAGEDGTVRAAVLLGGKETVPPRIRPGREVLRGLSPQPGFISPYPVPLQVALFGFILVGIWTTYTWVVWLLLAVRRAR